MRLLIVPSWYPTDKKKNDGIFFKEQAEQIASRGVDVVVLHCSIGSPKKGRNPLIIKINKKNINNVTLITVNWSFLSKISRIRRFQEKFIYRVGYFLYKCTYGRPDVVHSHSYLNAGLIMGELLRNENISHVVTEHRTHFGRGLVSESNLVRVGREINRSFLTIAVSEPFRKLLVDLTKCRPDKITYVPNLVSPLFNALDTAPKEDIIITTVCALTEKKGVDVLLKAFSLVHEEVRRVKLKIGGAGPEFTRLANMRESLGLTEDVLFLGEMNRNEVADLMNETDLYVCSSYFETFGVAIVEALSCGVPVVATRCGGPESIVCDLNGLLVEKGRVEELASAILDVLKNKNRYDADLIRKDCISRFGADSVVEKLKTIYYQAVQNQDKSLKEW